MEINLSFRTIWRSHNFSCPVLTDVPVKKMTVAIAGVNVKWKLIFRVKKRDLFPFQIGEVNFHDLMDENFMQAGCGCQWHTELNRYDDLELVFESSVAADDEICIRYVL